MKKDILVLFFSMLFLTACEYNVPLTSEHNIPIDHAVLGAWKIIPAENENGDTEIRIYEFSDTEYVIYYYENSGDLYFRAYAINIGGVPAVQLELIGNDEKPVGSDADERYQVVSYRMVDGLLEIRTLNSELVDDEIIDSETLKNAFIKHKDNPGLFNDPGFFKRLQD